MQAKQTGIGRVAENLIRHIAQIDLENEYLLIQRADLRTPIVSDSRFRVIHFSYDIASLRNYFFFGKVLGHYQPAVYHSLHSFLPFGIPNNVRTVVTLHDFNWIQRPSIAGRSRWRGWVSRLHGQPMHAYATRIADHIACISEQTKRDLFSLYPDIKKPVSVIHHGVNRYELWGGVIRSNIPKYAGSRFILSVGSGRASKNPEGTIAAFAKIKREPRFSDIRLLLIGHLDTASKLRATVRTRGLENDVDFLGTASDAELAFLLERAILLCFPSLWEGFGLPVIEAFAFGCPVIASNVASLKEIANGAALMIEDPNSVEEIAQAMWKIITDTPFRERMRREGKKKAASFSWDKAARGYIGIYKRLMK